MTDKSYSEALDSALAVRRHSIELTHQIPGGAPEDLYRKWNDMDVAMISFIRALEREGRGAGANPNNPPHGV